MHNSLWPLLEIWGIIAFIGFFLFKAGQWSERAKLHSKYTSWVPKDSIKKHVQINGTGVFRRGRMQHGKNTLRVIDNANVIGITSDGVHKKAILSVATANGRVIKNKGEQHVQ